MTVAVGAGDVIEKSSPVAVRGTVCGLPVALSVMLTEAVRVPVAVGVKVTLIVQLVATASEPPHVFVCAKSPLFVPVMAMPAIVNGAVPVLHRLTICAPLVPPTIWPPKLRLAPPSATIGAMPVPVSDTICGLPAALSLMVTAPLRIPLSAGVKVTLTVQLAPIPTLVPQLLVCAKSPDAAMLATVSAASPVFVNMNCLALLVVFTSWLGKAMEETDRLTNGAMPVPAKLSVCGLLLASSKTVTVAVRLPRSEGVNVTLITQLALAGRMLLQVLLSAKSLLFGPPTSISVMFMAALPAFIKVAICAEFLVPTSWGV